jgi:hypothetical protein
MFKMMTPITSKTLTIRQKITNYLEDSLKKARTRQRGWAAGTGQSGQGVRTGLLGLDGLNRMVRTSQQGPESPDRETG